MANELDSDVAEETSSRRKRDPEMLAMQNLLWQIEEFDEPARARIMSYLLSRYTEKTQ